MRILRNEVTFIQRGNYWTVHEEDPKPTLTYSEEGNIGGFPCSLTIRKHAAIAKFRKCGDSLQYADGKTVALKKH